MKREVALVLFVLVAALFRVIPHPPNFAPITALALFSGVTFSNRYLGSIIPLAAMVLSDIILGFYSISLWVYLSIIAISLFGFYSKKIKFSNIVISGLIFFIISNFGVWVLGYPKTIEGLALCYWYAIPFYGYSLVGDLFYSLVLKYSFEFIEQKWLTKAY